MIVSRPEEDQRVVVGQGELDSEVGLVGDNWKVRGSSSGPADPLRQLTIMNARAIDAVASDQESWPAAGDQLYVDLDIGIDNLPAGTILVIGEAQIEVTEPPHSGCSKFRARFGRDALAWVNSEHGRRLRLRGANARVIRGGSIAVGDRIDVLR